MRGEYNTRQKRDLLKFLKEHRMEHFSVDEMVFRLEGEGARIGRSTVYRYLEAMAEQGVVRKYANAQGITQYQHVEDESRCGSHFHMMCRQCGTLMHVDCEHIRALTEHIAEEHGFALDARETVLVGLCAHCGGKENRHGSDHAERCHHCV